MEPILGLLLLLALSRKGSGAAAPLFAPSNAHSASHFPPVPATAPTPPVPSPSVQAGKKWTPYHPLNQAVIARAEQLLHDSTMKVNDERLEPDPAGGGTMRYLKVSAPPGKVSVTAWKAAAPAQGAPATPARHAAPAAPGQRLAHFSPVQHHAMRTLSG